MWTVVACDRREVGDAQQVADEVTSAIAESGDVTVRGWYDVGGLRGDADLMVWTHAADSDALQRAYHGMLRTPLGRRLAAGLVAAGAPPSGGVQQGARARLPRR